MSEPPRQIEVTLLGQVYLLACPPGGEQRLSAAVAAVDREMSAIRDAGRIRARERIAVLAALNLAWRLAEQEPVAAAPAANGAAAPQSSIGSSEAHDEIDALIRRVDAALAQDGRLL